MGGSPFYFGIMKEKVRGSGRYSGDSKELKKPKLEQEGAGIVNRLFRPVGASFEAYLGAYRPITAGEKVNASETVIINGTPSVPCRIYGPMSAGIVSDELWKRLRS